MMSFEDVVLEAIHLNLANRANIGPPQAPPYMYMKEFGTVHINVGRQTGKTSFIKKFSESDDAVIVCNWSMARTFAWQNSSPTIICADSLSNFKNREFSTIWVDEPNLCFPTRMALNCLYETFATLNPKQMFVLLGE